MVYFSGAKINIGLNILHKREDGYHEIESIFYPIKWYDVLEAVKVPLEHVEIIPIFSQVDIKLEENLMYRAWKLLYHSHSIPPVRFYLWKRVPMQAGLGGGSANAAGTLLLLKNMFNLHLPEDVLHKFAEQLGSDVPFFLYSKPALVTGRGEHIEPIQLDLSGYKIQVVVPRNLRKEKGISTREAYKLIFPHEPTFQLKDILNLPINKWREYIKNDFESVIFPRFPLLEEIKSRLLKEGALYASMSGTGSAVYGIFERESLLPTWDSQKYLVFEQG
jgi:4-diphosphocytidyl-2-C-methyl-D-erythritol kinase